LSGKTSSLSDRAAVMRLGEEVHRLLASLEWVDEDAPSLPSSLAGGMVSRFLQSPPGKLAFRRPEGAFDLWRERAFDVLLEGDWVSGVFDRVILLRNADFRIESVHLMDFKVISGDTAQGLDEMHGPQMLYYRKALAALLQIPFDSVRASLLPIPVS
jgi:ATP-dependent helicase/nuclease subunit A